MATYQKRGAAWRAIVRRAGRTATKTFDTKTEAQAWAMALEARIIDGVEPEPVEPTIGKPAPPEDPTVAKLFNRYSDEISPGKKGGRWEQVRLKNFVRRYPLFQRAAKDITGPDMADWRDERLKAISPSSVNRELCLVSSVFQQAIREWRIGLTVNPCALISKPRKPRARTQRVSVAERKRIIKQLGWDGVSEPRDSQQWAALAFYIALETAMRKGEILALTWGDVHFESRHAHLRDTKNGDHRDVPLSKAAMALLRIPRRGRNNEPVIPLASGNLDKLFRTARRDLGLMHIHFHDTRREAATTMAPKLSNVLELAAITGHRSLSMLQVYYKPKAADLAAKLD